jgi:hypothetical protein
VFEGAELLAQFAREPLRGVPEGVNAGGKLGVDATQLRFVPSFPEPEVTLAERLKCREDGLGFADGHR